MCFTFPFWLAPQENKWYMSTSDLAILETLQGDQQFGLVEPQQQAGHQQGLAFLVVESWLSSNLSCLVSGLG